ncbi:TPA: ribonuclease HI family protein [Candidatus Poribacteria bacterium]|nr:ribonuclease HI family protein [Candidatus Poribacteria bacterium]
MRVLKIYLDGASSGNPGEAGYGFLIKDEKDNILAGKSGYIGRTTCNVAEYTALILALQEARKFNPDLVEIYTDSQLIVEQISGRYKVNSRSLKALHQKALSLLSDFTSFTVKRIPRSQNKEADKLATSAIKGHRKKVKGEVRDDPHKRR